MERERAGMTELEIAEGRHLDHEYGRYPIGRMHENAQHEVTINHDAVTRQIVVGSVPITKADIDSIAAMGVLAIVDLCGDNESLESQWAKSHGIDYLHEFVHDGHTPTQAQFRRLSQWIGDHILKGHKVYIHCHAGAGRAPTVASAYLIYASKLTMERALEILKATRRLHIVSGRQKLGLKTFEKSLGISLRGPK